MKRSNNTVIGIDVGGPHKGFHAVVLCEGKYPVTFIPGFGYLMVMFPSRRPSVTMPSVVSR